MRGFREPYTIPGPLPIPGRVARMDVSPSIRAFPSQEEIPQGEGVIETLSKVAVFETVEEPLQMANPM